MRSKAIRYAVGLAAVALGIAGAAGIAAASPAWVGAVRVHSAAIRTNASAPISDVSYRSRHYCPRYCTRRYRHRRYAHFHWRYGYSNAGCENTFPASCSYPYPYFGFVYGWHGIW